MPLNPAIPPRLILVLSLVVGIVLGLPTLATATEPPTPLVIGDTFTLDSKVLEETRRINVYRPPGYDDAGHRRYPVLYMPDGGMAEDFLHIAGLVQISTINGTMRPFLLVGIENTERRRDLTGPTVIAKDKEIAPRVGGSAAFRDFLRDELMPHIRASYRTNSETAIIGESLAGLFVVETLLLEPGLFNAYVAVDPSLWWNDEGLVRDASTMLAKHPEAEAALFLASAQGEIACITERLTAVLDDKAKPRITLHYQHFPEEVHRTIYHPAALQAFRTLFAPPPPPPPAPVE